MLLIMFIFFMIIIVVCVLYCVFNKNKDTVDEIDNNNVPDVKWPFINLKDENNKNVNMLCIRGPFNSDEHSEKNKKMFKKYIDSGIKFIGCSSYLSFPNKCSNTSGPCNTDDNKLDGRNIEDYVLGWCHCFREPDKYIKSGIPRILISESDFNSDRLSPDHNIEIKHDFIMYQPSDENCDYGWNSHNKNWKLAEHCLQVMCDEFNMTGVVIGRGDCKINVKNIKNIISTPFIEYHKGIEYLQSCKFLLCANYEDASPRTITEALSLDKPILVNEEILGGWKYVKPDTGLFFNKENFSHKINELYKLINLKKLAPRKHLLDNYTHNNTGKELKDFLKKINPELSDCEYVKFPIS